MFPKIFLREEMHPRLCSHCEEAGVSQDMFESLPKALFENEVVLALYTLGAWTRNVVARYYVVPGHYEDDYAVPDNSSVIDVPEHYWLGYDTGWLYGDCPVMGYQEPLVIL
jgi:hypothetical protein